MRTDSARPLDVPLQAAADDTSVLLESLHRAQDRGDHGAVDALLARIESHPTADAPAYAHAHAVASHSLFRRRWIERAAERAAAAMEFARGCGDVGADCAAQVAWARIEWAAGHLDVALRHLEAVALDMPEDLRQQVELHTLLGQVHGDLGHYERSETHHRQALEAARSSGLVDLQLSALNHLAARLLATAEQFDRQGQRVPTLTWNELDGVVREAERLVGSNAAPDAMAQLLATQGAALLQRGRLDDALTVLTRQRAIVSRQADRSSLPHAALTLARLHHRQGRVDAARAVLVDGIAEAERLAARERQAALHLEASTLEEAAEDYRAALFHHKRFHELREQCAGQAAQRRATALALRPRSTPAERRQRAISLSISSESLRRHADDAARAALLDPLTGLGNRRMLYARLPQLHADCRKSGLPLSLVLFDLDHFKQVNERFAPAVGDAVLRGIGGLLASQFRAGDLCVRSGGEEFAIAFPGLDETACRNLCERLRKQVAAQPWHLMHPDLTVTISLGAVQLATCDDVNQGVALAEQRLQAAKSAGRNRVVSDGEPAPRTH